MNRETDSDTKRCKENYTERRRESGRKFQKEIEREEGERDVSRERNRELETERWRWVTRLSDM